MDRTYAVLFALLIIGPAFSVIAREGTNGPSGKETAAGDESVMAVVDDVVSTNRLSRRDPFWPVGYEPAPPQENAVGDTADPGGVPTEPVNEIWPTLRLKGITRIGSGKYVGLLAGLGVVEKGDVVKCTRKSVVYRWEITGVGPDGIAYRRLEAVPLKERRQVPPP